MTAATLYTLTVFAIGFLLGVLRMLVLVPAMGEMGAVLLELPVILAASAFFARLYVNRYQLRRVTERLITGALAFGLLMLLEIILTFLNGGSLASWMEKLMTAHGAVGLAGQLVFALLPTVFRPHA
ncbi:hypothetical protein [Alterisphingorhabdus coralli]|uniref:Uncharacterized protein n=1 Tax=Alterisphingorhabdus coralli TaxID=3071408 RepID=A0AA97F760_9SPHN|nr:hypothetical protein [Parasphingorhabdus sp. SCSIO 66989]WOE75659.1 hypothetical protein RB602_02790 [Parasphingorhabdus sp. SCSIO 66989]